VHPGQILPLICRWRLAFIVQSLEERINSSPFRHSVVNDVKEMYPSAKEDRIARKNSIPNPFVAVSLGKPRGDLGQIRKTLFVALFPTDKDVINVQRSQDQWR